MGRRSKLSDQPFELDIISLNPGGLGIATHGEKKLRVLDALAGEKVMARHLFGRSHRGKAETLEVLQSSPDRVEPRCEYFGYCGACSLQHMSMSAQLERKQAALLEQLLQHGNIVPGQVYEPLCGPLWNYRRKARLSVRDVVAKEKVLVGFRERNGRYVADMDGCHILRKEIADALADIAKLIESLQSRTLIPQLEVACGDRQCALIIRHLEALPDTDLDRLRNFAVKSGLGLYLQSAGPDSVELLAPEDFQLEYRIDALGLRFFFEPLDFVQVNGDLNQKMVLRSLELLDVQPDDSILDLFCGLGNFTLPLATRAGHVTGVEGAQEMVQRGADNARLNGLDNVGFYAADLYKTLAEKENKAAWMDTCYNKIMLDPPRSGALELLPWIAAGNASHLLYLSCNPETLARDAAVLVNQYDFTLSGAGILNMFPHTHHSEAIALFERVVR